MILEAVYRVINYNAVMNLSTTTLSSEEIKVFDFMAFVIGGTMLLV